MNLQINTIGHESATTAWAFAVDQKHTSHRAKLHNSFRHLNHSVITACSKEAKKFGVKSGMRYKDARTLLPELKVLVYGRH